MELQPSASKLSTAPSVETPAELDANNSPIRVSLDPAVLIDDPVEEILQLQASLGELETVALDGTPIIGAQVQDRTGLNFDKVLSEIPDKKYSIGGDQNVVCFRCGQSGHFAKNCMGQGGGRTCFQCGDTSHISRDCPRDMRKRRCYFCDSVHATFECQRPQYNYRERPSSCWNCGRDHWGEVCERPLLPPTSGQRGMAVLARIRIVPSDHRVSNEAPDAKGRKDTRPKAGGPMRRRDERAPERSNIQNHYKTKSDPNNPRQWDRSDRWRPNSQEEDRERPGRGNGQQKGKTRDESADNGHHNAKGEQRSERGRERHLGREHGGHRLSRESKAADRGEWRKTVDRSQYS